MERAATQGSALVADDDEFFRVALKAILTSKLGFAEVVETGSFDEAASRLGSAGKAQAFSVALFDLSMPGIRNPSNLRAIREIVPDLPLVVVSASDRRRDILSALEAGVHGYVPKGLGIRELERALRRVLAGEMYVPRSLTEFDPAPEGDREAPLRNLAGTLQLPELTPRQRDVLTLIEAGKSNKEIARNLGLGEGTVKVHMSALFRILGVNNRTAAAAAALRFGPEES